MTEEIINQSIAYQQLNIAQSQLHNQAKDMPESAANGSKMEKTN